MNINPGAKLILTQTVAVQREGYPGNVLLILEKGEQGYVAKPTMEGVVSDLKGYGGVTLTGIFRSEGPETEGQDPNEVRVIVPVEDRALFFKVYDDTYDKDEEFEVIQPFMLSGVSKDGSVLGKYQTVVGQRVRILDKAVRDTDLMYVQVELLDERPEGGTYQAWIGAGLLSEYLERPADSN